MIERIAITDREQWLALRAKDVTASAIGGLFGLHPYTSALRIHKEKAGLQAPAPESGVLYRGQVFEPAVAAAVALNHPEWRIEKATDYFRDPDLRLGATPDFWIHGDPRGVGVLQAKTADRRVLERQWLDGEPPEWIALQNLVELMLTADHVGATWGMVACLTIDSWNPQCLEVEIPRHVGAEAKVRERVRKFWDDFAAGNFPPADVKADDEFLKFLYPAEVSGKTIDLSGDNYLPTLLQRRLELKAEEKLVADDLKEIDTEIKAKLEDAESATVGGDWRITYKVEPRKEYFVKASTPRVLRIKDFRNKE